ncbi:MAG: thiamine pyrophosphate-dependent dehydrogenase E1 component subunit alpha [Planctomycetes bacterium]|nr:thiamine pyrophosphate-dependent dehydrogenase E1 component subunit alpha [Planctomycetota bacterium]MCP4771213.1 thiamine pyrophosphate-dependent dehydrogenase E1 component subunit alpha [Planctomycetota bacterium]MCP4862060.1 thiamine pyrophosphate-dependent dehydrogenase E1 component subunit alpha [Planctomycetota bacterium]
MREDGTALLKAFKGVEPQSNDLLAIHRAMLTTRLMDARMMKLQRQGRVGFVGSSMGQEGAIHASAQAFGASDWIFSALREGGVTLQRGMSMNDYVAHMFGNAEDTAKGRQMPNHFQYKEGNFPSWSSVLGTQMPHAVGAAMAMQRRGEKNVVAAYTGDGATSTSGFHSAMNFAGVYKAPVVFLVIDNGWAISLPSAKQTAAKSYADKAVAYGMPGFNVDGMDVFAVFDAVEEARQRALAGKGPSLLNLRCYRQGGHSSSDDPTRYRNEEEVEYWAKRDPLARMENYLFKHDLLNDEELEQMNQSLTEQIKDAVDHAETVGAPPLESLVEDVFATPPHHLRRQVADALRIVAEKGDVDRLVGKFPL